MKSTNLIVFALPVLLLVFMFTSQRKRQRGFEQLQDRLQPGQDILTTSGLYARIVELDATIAVLETGPGQRMRWDRRTIASIVEPAADAAPATDES